jgi:hypothetical protein
MTHLQTRFASVIGCDAKLTSSYARRIAGVILFRKANIKS